MAKSESVFAMAVLPDGNGGFTPCPELLTGDEAIRFLRLDAQKADGKQTLRYYREKQLLKATKIGKNLLYSRRELERFVNVMTR